MAFERMEARGRSVLVALHTHVPPSADEWDAWTALLEREVRLVDGDLATLPNLVVTDGGAPNISQRTKVNNLVAQARVLPRVSIVTDSVIVRTVARAFVIFNPLFRVFAPAEVHAAAVHLGFGTADVPHLVERMRVLEHSVLGPRRVETLAALGRVRDPRS